jgi:hypothetical protein
MLAAGGAALLLALVMMLSRGSGKKSGVGTVTPTRTPTATPVNSPTPTPLALENQDSIIQGGDHPSSQSVAYAVNLQVMLPDSQPRVFVVQPRSVRTAQWNFDNNPDTASYLLGMAVRPIVGIPYSDENAAFFDKIGKGTQFALQMNTGAVLHYQFVSAQSILRSDTSVLRQIGPGLVLVLIGQMDDSGIPTASRPVVIAAYLPDQELSRDGLLVSGPDSAQPVETATPIPTPTNRVDVEVVSMTTDSQSKSMSVALRVFNAQQNPMTIGPDALWITLGYAPHPLGPRVPAEGLKPFDLLPGQAVNLTVAFPWNGEPYATVGTDGLGDSGTYQYSVELKQ